MGEFLLFMLRVIFCWFCVIICSAVKVLRTINMLFGEGSHSPLVEGPIIILLFEWLTRCTLHRPVPGDATTHGDMIKKKNIGIDITFFYLVL